MAVLLDSVDKAFARLRGLPTTQIVDPAGRQRSQIAAVEIQQHDVQRDLVRADPLDERDQSDPDLFIFRDGRVVGFGNSGEANQEIFRTAVLSGPDTYVADLQEFRYADPGSPVGFPDRMCFDVSFTPVP